MERRSNLHMTIDRLLASGIVPILNENDVVSTMNENKKNDSQLMLWDNDSLACLVACEVRAGNYLFRFSLILDLVVLLSDIDGLYKRPPAPGEIGEVVHTYLGDSFKIEGKSFGGTESSFGNVKKSF